MTAQILMPEQNQRKDDEVKKTDSHVMMVIKDICVIFCILLQLEHSGDQIVAACLNLYIAAL